MRFKRKKRRNNTGLYLAAGVVLTGVAAAYAVSRLLKTGPVVRHRDMRAMEKRVLQALLNDSVASTESIDITAVGVGTVELSGAVDSAQAARHVVGIVGAVAGVHNVLNRIEIRSMEARLQQNRTRTGGETTRWYGGSVGMGRRRQSVETDPTRRDDHAALLERSLEPNRDETLADVEDAGLAGVKLSRNAGFRTNVAAHSPEPSADMPLPPTSIAPHEVA